MTMFFRTVAVTYASLAPFLSARGATASARRSSAPLNPSFIAPSWQRVHSSLETTQSDDTDDGGDSVPISKDWRDFRAELVLRERRKDAEASSTWAYDSRRSIERGSVVLSRPRPAFGGGLLRRPFWHKALILVLDHGERKKTRGIFLNRPSDRTIVENGVSWRVWYGGPVQDANSPGETEFVCLHSIRAEAITGCSTGVMKDIQYTTFDRAKELVRTGDARPEDFWVFAGYCGWSAGQLQKELESDFWISVTTDSQTLLRQLARESAFVEPRRAGLDTWKSLMDMIGREEMDALDGFDDLLLKEWARENLLLHPKEGDERPVAFAGEAEIEPGMIVRASSRHLSPFLLSEQDMHKSTVLIISDNAHGTIGVLLNLPTTKAVDLPIKPGGKIHANTVPILQRYGGSYVVFGEGERPLLWLHCNEKLRNARIGIPLSPSREGGIWECTSEDVAKAIENGLGSPEDFMAVSGGYVWEKCNEGQTGGMRGQVWDGKFEVTAPNCIQPIWDTLLSQELMSSNNIEKNLEVGNLAWDIAGGNNQVSSTSDEGPLVFESDVKVTKLADVSLQRWVAKYILNDPGCIAPLL